MAAVDEVVTSLKPTVGHLIEHLELSGQLHALAFFQHVEHLLINVQEEDELLDLFMLLSMTAFQGFQLDPMGAVMADHILSYAQDIAHTFSADDGTAH